MLKFSSIEIEQQNEKELILQIKCFVLYLFKMLSVGVIFLLLSLSLYIPSSIDLACHKNQTEATSTINCKLTKYNLWGISKNETEISANSYHSAIQRYYIGDSSKPDYKVILTADEEKIEITNYSGISNSTRRDLWDKQNKQINNFMTKDELNSLNVGENNVNTIFTVLYLIAIILFVNLIIVFVRPNISFTLSKESNTLLIRKYNYLTKEVREVSLEEIERVFLENSNSIDNLTSRIAFKLKSGESIPLTSWFDSLDQQPVLKKIRKFLK